MVFRFSLIPGILGSHDGPNDLCSAPDIDATSPFHRSLLRVYWAYFIFQSWTWKHSSYLACMHFSVSLPGLVLGQLLPNGLKWVETRDELRRSKSRSMDDWINNDDRCSGSLAFGGRVRYIDHLIQCPVLPRNIATSGDKISLDRRLCINEHGNSASCFEGETRFFSRGFGISSSCVLS